jgi:hypothetical protein
MGFVLSYWLPAVGVSTYRGPTRVIPASADPALRA